MKLLLTLPYCTKDASLLQKMLDWMAELQPKYLGHSCLLVADQEVPPDQKIDLQNRARKLFDFADTMIVRVPADKQNWPAGPNLLFASAARQIHESYKLPWLWFEPDAVPLVSRWLDIIAREYERTPKRFMGSLVPANNQPDMPPVHMAGCGVYPADAWVGLEPILKTATRPFDIVTASYVVPRATNFPRMQHYWGDKDLFPTFKETVTVLDPKNFLTLDFIKPESVTFHRCKDGSLMALKQKAAISEVTLREPSPIVVFEKTPAPVLAPPGINIPAANIATVEFPPPRPPGLPIPPIAELANVVEIPPNAPRKRGRPRKVQQNLVTS